MENEVKITQEQIASLWLIVAILESSKHIKKYEE